MLDVEASVAIAGVKLPPDAPVRREPTRPVEARQPDFDDRFDFETVFYDAVWTPDGAGVRLLGPAMLNLADDIARGTVTAMPGREPCRFSSRHLDRHSEMLVRDVPPGTQVLKLVTSLGTFEIEPVRPQFDMLAGRRVIFTLSRNNHLDWIGDWARFYRDVHGADAVLLYDNRSDAYGTQELSETLSRVSGLKAVVVVDWPFLHGPPGIGLRGHWDSNFSQLGVFADARWRFLHKASSVLNCDIDELVVSRRGASLFETVEASSSGVVSFSGDWVFGLEGVTRVPKAGDKLRFVDYGHRLKSRWDLKYGVLPYRYERCKAKWAVVPARTPASAQWHIHSVAGWPVSRLPSLDLSFRHYREINFSWKYDRMGRHVADPARHVDDPVMQKALRRVDWTG